MTILSDDLARLLNKHSRENESNTPDFILAEYMLAALEAFEKASRAREDWYDHPLSIGMNAAKEAAQ